MDLPVVCFSLFAILPGVFVLFAAPWMAARGPWVKYDVDVERIPKDAKTSELYLQYPMLMFERQQHASEMCFTRMSTKLFDVVFHLEPRYDCDEDNDSRWGNSHRRRRWKRDYHFRNYRCVVWYCLSEWSVLTNNATRFSHHVSVSMGRLYHLLIADACWFLWCLPGFLMLRWDGTKTIAGIYLSLAFTARVALSIAAMTEFYRHDRVTDPPGSGYVQNSQLLRQFTTRSYSWGFACAWIVVIGNGIILLVIIPVGIYYCVVGCQRLNDHASRAKTRLTSSLRRRQKQPQGDVVAADARATAANDPDPDLRVDTRLKSGDDEETVA